MTYTEQDFLNKILSNPGEDLPCLIYADWLEEQGSYKATQVRQWVTAKNDPTEDNCGPLGELDDIIARLSEQYQRQCACEFAWRVLPLFESEYPSDDHPKVAIEIAWRYSIGLATQEELDAARAAARAARDAAWDAWDAARDARAARAAWSAARAARAAVRAAARDARDAAWDAARAARAAVRAAARDAAWNARDAVRAAARAAARAAENRHQVIIATSYLLFGGNALAGRYEYTCSSDVVPVS